MFKRPRFAVDVLQHLGQNDFNDTGTTATSSTTTIASSDIIRLILTHLTECGLHDSVRILQQESGIGMAGTLHPYSTQYFIHHAITGQWGNILQQLSLLDKERSRIARFDANLIAAVHEMTILELAECNEWETAFAVFRLLQQDEEMALSNSEIANSISTAPKESSISIGRSLDQKLAQLMAERQKDPKSPIPNDFYGTSTTSSSTKKNSTTTMNVNEIKQHRRNELGKRLQEAIPILPLQRLPTLLQQAMKWQTYTGQVPVIRRLWENDDDTVVANNDDRNVDKGTDGEKTKRKWIKEFDLVLGELSVDIASATVGNYGVGRENDHSLKTSKHIAGLDYATIKLGKNVTAEASVFLPDGTGIVTGSSDGLIEIWDNNGQIRNDLEYQQKEEMIGHDNGCSISALAISNDTTLIASGATDGVIHIWRIDTGKCLRTITTTATDTKNVSSSNNSGVVSCICFSPDSTHVLAGNNDGICREFGLRTSRMLKEFRGHMSYITCCYYHLSQQEANFQSSSMSSKALIDDEDAIASSSNVKLLVITSSGDGSVRIWDGKTMDTMFVLRPISVGLRSTLSQVGSSIATIDTDRINSSASSEGSPPIHSMIPLHTPPNTMILVPRGLRAFLVDYKSRVLRIYQGDTSTSSTVSSSGNLNKNESRNPNVDDIESGSFVAATVSSNNRWLYAVKDDGKCCIFDVSSGKMEKVLNDFGTICTASSSSTSSIGKGSMEISNIAHHPFKGVIAAYSSNKNQKRGKVVLWK